MTAWASHGNHNIDVSKYLTCIYYHATKAYKFNFVAVWSKLLNCKHSSRMWLTRNYMYTARMESMLSWSQSWVASRPTMSEFPQMQCHFKCLKWLMLAPRNDHFPKHSPCVFHEIWYPFNMSHDCSEKPMKLKHFVFRFFSVILFSLSSLYSEIHNHFILNSARKR